MVPSITAVRMSGARHRTELPLLVLGPAADTSATALWAQCAAGLTDAFDVLAWDLPGQGYNRSVPEEPCTPAELAQGVLHVVDDILEQRDDVGGAFYYASGSVGDAVGVQLVLDAPARVAASALVRGSAEPAPDSGALLAGSGTAVLVVPGVGALAPAEAPEVVARLLREHFLGEAPAPDFVHDVRGLVADHAAGDVEKRPGLDPRSRSLVVLTALASCGDHEELAPQVRAALAHGVGADEIRELLLQTAVYCGVPDAHAAYLVVQRVLAEAGS